MNEFEEFIKIATTDEMLKMFIDNIEETPYGLRYQFDGIMYCHIVRFGNKYIDVQDEPKELDLNPKNIMLYGIYNTPGDIARHAIEVLHPPKPPVVSAFVDSAILNLNDVRYMSKTEFLEVVLYWHGIVGYAENIIQALDDYSELKKYFK